MTSKTREPILWLDGALVPVSKARISPFDTGWTTGDGVFETLRSYRGRVFALNEHHERFCGAASVFELPVPSLEDLADAVGAVLEANRLLEIDARIRITLTGGESTAGSLRVEGSLPILAVTAAAIAELPATATVSIVPFRRNPRSAVAGIKTTSYAENLIALRHARTRRADEGILADTAGDLCEGTTSNLFLVLGGRLLTPPLSTGCLPGVTRAVALRAFREAGIELEERRVPLGDLAAADEAFLTSSLREVHPISAVDSTELPSAPGPITNACRTAFLDLRDRMLEAAVSPIR